MNSELYFVLALVIVVLVFFVFYRNLQKQFTSTLRDLQDARTSNVILKAERDKFSDLYERLEKQSANREKELVGNMKLYSDQLIARGTQAMRKENEVHLQQMLQPLHENIVQFRSEVVEQKERGLVQHTELNQLIRSLHLQHREMHSTAQSLVDALRGDQKMQGDWGEFSLLRLLETSGLEKGVDYKTQDVWRNDQGNVLRPDVVVYLPEEKHLVIDSKVSLVAFERYINAEEQEVRTSELQKHVASLKTHISKLAEKNYADLTGLSSPEFVLLYIPLESSFALAIKEEPALFELAFSKKIVIVTPSTLLATLKTVSSIWKHEKQTKNALEISEQAGRLYDKFVGFIDDLEKVGAKQIDAQKAFSDAMNKLKDGQGNLIRSAERLKELGVKSKKEIDKKLLGE